MSGSQEEGAAEVKEGEGVEVVAKAGRKRKVKHSKKNQIPVDPNVVYPDDP